MPASPNCGLRSPRWNRESIAQCSFRRGPSSGRWSASLESSSVPSGCSADTFGRCGSRVRPSQPVGRWDTAIALMRLPG